MVKLPSNIRKYRSDVLSQSLKYTSSSPPGLGQLRKSYEHYCIIGAGKTGADAVLHLLEHGINPDKIIWVMPNDVWFMNRKYFTFDKDFIPNVLRMLEGMTSKDNKTWEDSLLRSSDHNQQHNSNLL